MNGNFYYLFPVLMSLNLCVSVLAFLLGFYGFPRPCMPLFLLIPNQRQTETMTPKLQVREPGVRD